MDIFGSGRDGQIWPVLVFTKVVRLPLPNLLRLLLSCLQYILFRRPQTDYFVINFSIEFSDTASDLWDLSPSHDHIHQLVITGAYFNGPHLISSMLWWLSQSKVLNCNGLHRDSLWKDWELAEVMFLLGGALAELGLLIFDRLLAVWRPERALIAASFAQWWLP